MNRSEKFNFYLPQNIDPIDVSNFDYNFEIIDENLITEEQELTSTQKANARANLDLGDAALQTVANNLTTSSAGSVLDARQGKALGDRTTANESAVSAIRNSIAIVASGNTHGAITAGQYVYVHSHSSLNEGLYTANSNISANATLSASNLTAVSGGGLNALNSNIKILYSKTYTVSFDAYGSGTIGTRAAQKSVSLSSDISTYGNVASLFISQIDNSSAANYQAFMNGTTLYVNAYRAVSDATDTYSVKVTVTFAKQA